MAMTLTTTSPANQRLVNDGYLMVNTALPVAANTVNTNALDLVQATPYPVTEKVYVNVATSAATSTANSKNINVVLQHSATNVSANFVNIPELNTVLLRVTDNGSTVTPAGSSNVQLPPSVKRYIRAQATGEVNGGAATGSVYLQLNF
jgi:hypothetical protein